MSPKLHKVVERAKERPEERFTSLAHLIDVSALTRVYQRIRKDAAVGVDGITKEAYGQDLEGNLRDLHGRMKSKRYRHQPIRRVHIPKEDGRTRPIGISAFEDKLAQGAVRDVLEAIYEQDFLDCSYGFRPGRSAHGAVRAIDQSVHRGEVSWILEADIVSFFDCIDRKLLMEMLQIRPVVRAGGETSAWRESHAHPLCRRSPHRLRETGRCGACDERTPEADGAIRTDPSPGQDPTHTVR
jgi:RNA-directed DNA polymerase